MHCFHIYHFSTSHLLKSLKWLLQALEHCALRWCFLSVGYIPNMQNYNSECCFLVLTCRNINNKSAHTNAIKINTDIIVLLLTRQLWGLDRWCAGFPRDAANQWDRPKPGRQLTNRPNISLTVLSIKVSLQSNKGPVFLLKSDRNLLKRTTRTS